LAAVFLVIFIILIKLMHYQLIFNV